MNVAALTDRLKHATLESEGARSDVSGITNDSRDVRDGYLYAALAGDHVDGHSYIPQAIAAGATAILASPSFYRKTVADHETVSWIIASEPRMALSELSDRFFGSPSTELPVIGVTGTDGKTSTVYFIHQLLQLAGERSAFLSTAAMQIGDDEQPNMLHQSTPEAPRVHQALREMIDSGATAAVLESTSHGLSDRTARLAHVTYQGAVFTNISHEHLEFHGTFEQYRSDKANLFRRLRVDSLATAFGVINAHDKNAEFFAESTSARVVRYGIDLPDVDYLATSINAGTTGTRFEVSHANGKDEAHLLVPGTFNVLNALAAIAAVHELTGTPVSELCSVLHKLRSVSGRMEVIAREPFSVVVDYAHTPASFEHALPFFRNHAEARLIVVFGSAGERDRKKRPLQGAIADRFCDIVVLADEDPRGEDAMSILEDIASGMTDRTRGEDLFLIPDRREAVRKAFLIAEPPDTVVLLGKGHEASIIGPDGAMDWNEAEVARSELSRIGYQ